MSILTNSFNTNITDPNHVGVDRTLQIYDKKVKMDISDFITTIDPQKAPFTRFLDAIGTKEETRNFKFEYLEEDNKKLKTEVAVGSGIINDATLTNTDFQTVKADMYTRDDIIKIFVLADGTSEHIRIASKTNATTYVVERGVSGTTGLATIASADEAIKIGSNHDENSLNADPDHVEPVWYFNYTQNFKSSVSISGRFKSMDTRGRTEEITHQLNIRMRDHLEALEAGLILGNRNQTGQRTYTGGLDWFIDNHANSDNYYDASDDTFDEAWLDRKSNEFFRYGGDHKVAIVGGNVISKIATFAKERLVYNDKLSTTLGMTVQDYHSSHGDISFIHSRFLEESTILQKKMYLFDPKLIKKRYLPGRDTHVNMNVQENARDGEVHEILTDCGLEVRLPDAHFVINGLDDAIA